MMNRMNGSSNPHSRFQGSPGESMDDLKDAFLLKHPGLKALNDECLRVYPNQSNPLQIKSLVKCWMGGPDPLDYISMYSHNGDSNLGVLPHWHYITYGLSDLYGDGRLFPVPNAFGEDRSGFGFELTFRLLKSSNESVPPTWPATLLQSAARYVFASGQVINPGDHIAWHCPLNLDDQNGENENLRHIITIKDPEFTTLQTPQGCVEFVQIVPVTNEELVAVQSWNVPQFAELMSRIPECGGQYLVADMKRTLSALTLYPEFTTDFNEGVERDGSDLGGANARVCSFADDAWKYFDSTNIHLLPPDYQVQLRQLKGIHEEPAILNEPHEHSGAAGHELPRSSREPKNLNYHKYRDPKAICSDFSSSSSEDSDDEHEPTAQYDENTDVMLSADLCDNLNFDPAPTNQPYFNGARGTNSSSAMSVSRLDGSNGGLQIQYFDNIHLTLDLEAGLLMPIALKGRLRHARPFTFNGLNNMMITLASPRVQGLFVNPNKKFAVCFGAKIMLQILIDDELLDSMIRDFDVFLNEPNAAFPKTLIWPGKFLAITIVV